MILLTFIGCATNNICSVSKTESYSIKSIEVVESVSYMNQNKAKKTGCYVKVKDEGYVIWLVAESCQSIEEKIK